MRARETSLILRSTAAAGSRALQSCAGRLPASGSDTRLLLRKITIVMAMLWGPEGPCVSIYLPRQPDSASRRADHGWVLNPRESNNWWTIVSSRICLITNVRQYNEVHNQYNSDVICKGKRCRNKITQPSSSIHRKETRIE
jgi:hypothetical protein